ncbi:MAG: aminoglycoside phosphotransferase family protein, partial [Longimicrobiales bacterium]
LAVDYVLNQGGFVNYSYRIGDARSAYHLKLSTSVEGRESLARWKALSSLLEPHHAPRILEWIDLGPAAGLLFPHVAGGTPVLGEKIIDAILPVLSRLGADRDLAARLNPMPALTANDAYLSTFHDRFTEDLNSIREAQPPFVDTGLVEWLEAEVEALADIARATPAFAEPLSGAVHGDLWLNNILWVSSSDWHLVDWDDVRIGDPAADLASFLGPSAHDLRPLKLRDRVVDALSASERERLQLLGRATLLDWVIDPVADWIDAVTAPAQQREVRAEKARIHLLALGLYRQLY